MTISRSEVMTKAWAIYNNCRNMFPTFSDALSRAWEVIKANIAYRSREKEEAEYKSWSNLNQDLIRSIASQMATNITANN